MIDAFQGGEDLGPLRLRKQGPRRAFELANGLVALEADNQDVAQLTGGPQALDVSGMEQIKATVSPDHRPARPAVGFAEVEQSGQINPFWLFGAAHGKSTRANVVG